MYKSLDEAREDIRGAQSKPKDDGIATAPLPLGPALPVPDEVDLSGNRPRGPMPSGPAGY